MTVTPGMCGPGALLFGRVGDWTWEAVRQACRTNVFLARSASGAPTYLSFYYFHVIGTPGFDPYRLTFGDEIEVTSRVFDFGRSSVLTLHRLAGPGADVVPGELEPEEFYERRRPGCGYVENFNRWISRGRQDSNSGLVEATPVGFAHTHLSRLPSCYSPRVVCGNARRTGSFLTDEVPGFTEAGPAAVTTYRLDPVRDLNGVGLTYFAAYFAVIDSALLNWWRRAGRSDHEFLRRRLLDHRLGYFGNADLGAVLTISVRVLLSGTEPGEEIADVAVRESGTGRLLAVAAIHLGREQP
ncbi:LnmK family bifunctional acyltransferase/decarboxylase [Amycolatopsis magusensis]|uniref:LnmK family bifunctional acyltransferase/decarboxylase n=1 Tax=Amycolatopsis magusensis TaxID=882444 RepID=UPI003C2C3DDE